jgi:hypothetical protein
VPSSGYVTALTTNGRDILRAEEYAGSSWIEISDENAKLITDALDAFTSRADLSNPAPVAAPATASEAAADEKLTVWFGSMPESNGKENWTAILYRQSGSLLGGIEDGFTLARSEYHDRVRYDADMVRHLLGELPERPDILAYDGDMKSGAGDSADAPVQQAGEVKTALLIEALEAMLSEAETHCRSPYCDINFEDALLEQARAALKGEQPVEPSGTERGNAA